MRRKGRWKRTLAAISAFAMTAAMAPGTVFADEAVPQEAGYAQEFSENAEDNTETTVNESDIETDADSDAETAAVEDNTAEDSSDQTLSDSNITDGISADNSIADVSSVDSSISEVPPADNSIPAEPLSAEVKAGTPYNTDGAYDVNVPHVVVNQVYGGSDNGFASHSFIELYNQSAQDVDLSGWKIAYRASVDGNGDADGWQYFELTGKIPANGFYLVRCGQVSAPEGDYAVPEGDQQWDMVLHNKGVSVVLLSEATELTDDFSGAVTNENRPEGYVDLLAVQGNDGEDVQLPPVYEGSIEAKQSKKKSVRRENFADTDDNAADSKDVNYEDPVSEDEGPHNSSMGGAVVDPGEDEKPSSEPFRTTGYEENAAIQLTRTGDVSLGSANADGGVAEIVSYNEDNGKAYVVNGQDGLLYVVDVKADGSLAVEKSINVKNLIADFAYGDMTSVAVDKVNNHIVVALQAADYTAQGRIAVLDYDGNFITSYTTGVQPDMVTVSSDGKWILTADEGEPRQGYGAGAVDPAGTVTVVNTQTGEVKIAGFDGFDSASLASAGVLITKPDGQTLNSAAADLEPEYIALNSDGTKAYVALQEANAIAALDIETASFTSINSLGFQDFSREENAIDLIEDGKYEASTYPNTVGVRMPDGISTFEAGGVTYLVTANEGDAREWGDFINEAKAEIANADGVTAEKVRVLDPSVTAGLQDGVNYIYGSRSFTIYNADTMELVYDSANQFESKTAGYLADWFNCSNDDIEIDSRSAKKGVEPETTTVKEIDGRMYAFIGLERIGGIMVYDVTDPSSASYVNYINTRDFSSEIAGDVAPEGLAFIPAAYSESGSPVLLAACEVSGTVAAYTLSGSGVTPGAQYDPSQNDNTPVIPGGDTEEPAGAVVLYTNDIHCATDGYSYLAAYQAQLEEDGYDVVTVDIGDAIQGEVIGSNSEGAAIVDIMNTVGYDFAVPGNHEFDYGLERFLAIAVGDEENAPEAQYEYLSCNFVDLASKDTVLAPYEIVEMNGEQVAFVGISTPETYTKSTPAYFQDENGNFIYSFSEDKFYETIQNAVNKAISEGADRVIALGHLGIEGTTEGWKSTDVIANTTGIDAFIDAHSHETIAESEYANKDGEMVPLTSTGTKFANFGVMTLNEDGTYATQLIAPKSVDVNSSEAASAAYTAVQDKVDGYNEELAYLNEKLGTSEVELTINDADGVRRIRNGETNMGDFVADAYRVMTGADVALVNGGGIRDSIAAGDVTRKDLMDVNPWNNEMCVIRATGQQILDALEHGARLNPEENGGFLQVSGLTYEIHNYIESPVVTDSMEMFQSVDSTKERRVQNVMIGGKAIDPQGTYTVAGSFYTLQEQGDGFTMFEGAEVLEHENLPVDSEMLIKYFTEELGGVISADMYGNPLGDGRITVLTQEKQETPDPDEDLTPSPTPGGDDNDGQQGGSDQDQNAGQKPGQNGNAGGSNTGTNGGKGGSVNTGDPTDMYGLFAVMAVAAGAAGCAIYYIQRQRKHGDN